MQKLQYIHALDYLPLGNKNEQAINTCSNMGGPQIHYAKTAGPKGYVLCDCICMTFWKRQNYKDRKPVNSCQGRKGQG